MLSERDLSAAIGSTAQGPDGEKIGTVESFFVDDRTGAPTWVAVATGLFGTRHSIVPATQATFTDGVLRVPVGKEAVRSAPHLRGDHLGPDEEAQLRQHYGLTAPVPGGPGPDAAAAAPGTGTWSHSGTGLAPTGAGPVTGVPGTAGVDGPVPPAGDEPPADGTSAARDTGATAPAAPTQRVAPVGAAGGAPAAVPPQTAPQAVVPAAAQDAAPRPASDGSMVRSEEQLRVGTEQVATTRVRLVKYVVTEEVQVTVPIRREEIRVEHVPLDAPDVPGESLTPAGTGAPAPAGAPAGTGVGSGLGAGLPEEIVLHAERPVVGVEVVPVERVRLRTELIEGQEQVTEQVQREQIVVDETPAPPIR